MKRNTTLALVLVLDVFVLVALAGVAVYATLQSDALIFVLSIAVFCYFLNGTLGIIRQHRASYRNSKLRAVMGTYTRSQDEDDTYQ